MRHHRLTRSAALGLALVAMTAPTAAAQSQDLRSPDARDSTPAAQTNVGALDQARRHHRLRALGGQDLRAPDTRDAAADRPVGHAIDQERYVASHGTKAPTPPSADILAPAPQVQSTDPGFDWGDAGIGAGILLALILLGLGSTLAVVHRRHGAPAPRETATTG
jgi:hypothetical protein